MLPKIIYRSVKKSVGRFLAILLIIALGVGFFCGLRVTERAMLKTADGYINGLSLYDLRLINTLGFTDKELDALKTEYPDLSFYPSFGVDIAVIGDGNTDKVLHAHVLLEGVNGIDLVYGKMPESDDECVVDNKFAGEEAIGEYLVISPNTPTETKNSLLYNRYKIVGIANSSEYINFQRGTTSLSGGSVSGFVYLPKNSFVTDVYTDIYVRSDIKAEIFSDEYASAVESLRDKLLPFTESLAENRYNYIRDDTDEKIISAREEISENKKLLSDKKQELETAKNEFNEAISASEEALKALKNNIASLGSQISAVNEKLSSLSPSDGNYKKLTAQKESLTASYNDLKSQYDSLYSAVESQKTEANDKFKTAETKINASELTLRAAENDLSAAENKLSTLETPSVYVLDRKSNYGYAAFEKDIAIVSGVAKVFPLFFFLVAALVCITTMTRMVSEQRTENGVLKALGYSDMAVTSQYLVYAGSASALGSVAGFLLGSRLMPLALWQVYRIMYSIERDIVFVLDYKLFAVCSSLYMLGVLAVTYAVCRKDLRENAASLMRPTAPSAGKRIFLEYIGFIWRRMPFLHKVSARNIFRYKKRMVMMIFGIGGCTALLLTGFGIKDTIRPILDRQYGEISLYDINVKFRDTPGEDDINEFYAAISDTASDNILVRTESVTLALDSGEVDVELGISNGSLTRFVDLHSGKNKIALPKSGEAVINYRISKEYNVSVGDEIKIRDSALKEFAVRVSGIYDNYIGDTVYINENTYKTNISTDTSPNAAYVILNKDVDKHSAGAKISDLDNVAVIQISDDVRETVGNMLGSLDYIVLIVLVCAGALAFIVLYNLTNITITERIREIATLKVLGFYRNEQNSYVFRENLILSAISALCGFPLGIALLRYTMGQIKIANFYFGCTVSALSFVWAFVITMLFAVLVDLAMTKKIKNIDMAQAMKSPE